MAEGNQSPRAEDEMNVNDTVILRDLPVGAKVKLRSGAIGEITGNPVAVDVAR